MRPRPEMVAIRLTTEERRRLEKLAEDTCANMSVLVRILVFQKLDELEATNRKPRLEEKVFA